MKKYQKKEVAPNLASSKKLLPVRKSNNHSIDKNKKAIPPRNPSNILVRNINYNKSVIANHNDPKPKENHIVSQILDTAHTAQQKNYTEKLTVSTLQRLKTEPS